MTTSKLQDLLAAKGLRLIDLARRLGVNKATVTRWSRGNIPPENVIKVEKETGIPREVLRPDIYPPEDALSFRHEVARSEASAVIAKEAGVAR